MTSRILVVGRGFVGRALAETLNPGEGRLVDHGACRDPGLLRGVATVVFAGRDPALGTAGWRIEDDLEPALARQAAQTHASFQPRHAQGLRPFRGSPGRDGPDRAHGPLRPPEAGARARSRRGARAEADPAPPRQHLRLRAPPRPRDLPQPDPRRPGPPRRDSLRHEPVRAPRFPPDRPVRRVARPGGAPPRPGVS